MKIEVRELMSESEMLSHVFLGCIKRDDLEKIRDKYIGKKIGKKNQLKYL